MRHPRDQRTQRRELFSLEQGAARALQLINRVTQLRITLQQCLTTDLQRLAHLITLELRQAEA